ncbi:MAG: hypothetical protein AB1938_26080 [Myxococcota bacterium]
MPADLLYRIVDEPSPSPWKKAVVRPFWPWLAMALAGTWLAVPWFIVNALALGSPTRRREIALAAAVPVLMVLVVVGAQLLFGLSEGRVPYVLVAVRFAKLLAGYVLFTWQARAFQLHEHFGGDGRNGVLVLMVGFMLREKVLKGLGDVSPFLLLGGL